MSGKSAITMEELLAGRAKLGLTDACPTPPPKGKTATKNGTGPGHKVTNIRGYAIEVLYHLRELSRAEQRRVLALAREMVEVETGTRPEPGAPTGTKRSPVRRESR